MKKCNFPFSCMHLLFPGDLEEIRLEMSPFQEASTPAAVNVAPTPQPNHSLPNRLQNCFITP